MTRRVSPPAAAVEVFGPRGGTPHRSSNCTFPQGWYPPPPGAVALALVPPLANWKFSGLHVFCRKHCSMHGVGGSVGHVAAACVAELLATRGPAGCWCWLGANDSPPQRGRDLLIPPVLGDCLLFLLSCSYFSPLIPRLSGLSPRFWTSYFHPIILSSYHPKPPWYPGTHHVSLVFYFILIVSIASCSVL